MNDDLELLASAYLDDDVTSEERALVEASPELLAAVERLRQVRAVLASGEPAAISMRERHLAAALDVWDRLPDLERGRDLTPAGMVAPRPASLDRRRRTVNRTWVLAAAAGLIVVLGGGIVINGLNTSSGDDSAADAPPLAAPSDATASDQPSVAEERALATDSATGEELVTEAAADLAPDAGAVALDAAGGDEPIGGAEAPPPDDDLADLRSLSDLSDFAVSALNATVSADPPAATDAPAETVAPSADGGFDIPRCPGIDIVVGLANYNGELVVVGIDEDANEAVAHTVECLEVARALLP